MKHALLLALGLLLVPVGASAQTLYKSVSPDGKVVYSDKPPAEGRLDKTMKFDKLPASTLPADTLASLEALRKSQAAAPPPQGVVLYMAKRCGYCTRAKAYLAAKAIVYQEIDIDTPSGKAAFAQAGGRGVPLLLARGETLRGFSADAYDAVFTARS